VTDVTELPFGGRSGGFPPAVRAEKKRAVLDHIWAGGTLKAAAAKADIVTATVRDWRRGDPEFAREYNNASQGMHAGNPTPNPRRLGLPEFDRFRRTYLKQPLFPLHYNLWDVIEGREPRYLDPQMVYEKHERTRVICNVPPNHGKTTCFSIDYPVYLINNNPGISIAIVSKSQGYAKKVLLAIKTRLTSRVYAEMHSQFAPEGGWKDPDGSWTQTQIYVSGKYDGDTEKEPTVEAVGLGGHIYGGRFDVIILDDVIDTENAHRFADQADWCMTMIDSRLPPDGGLLLVLGTRLASQDLYSELRSRTTEDGEQFFTYFSQPAVLEYKQEFKDWRTLWPYQTTDESAPHEMRCIICYRVPSRCKCLRPDIMPVKPRWTGERLAKRRYPLGERRWSLVWQQQQLPDDATFRYETLTTSIDPGRMPGTLTQSWRPNGSADLYVVGGLDPATVGHTSMVVSGLDRFSGKRWVLDGFDAANCSPRRMRDKIQELTDKFSIAEWVIERNAFQKFLTDDMELRRYLQSRGCKLTAHFTGMEKRDADFGVMSMAPLFESTGRQHPQTNVWIRVRNGDERIVLPDPRQHAWIATLIQQLAAWEPQGMVQRQKTDLVMALWFTEIAHKKILNVGNKMPTHVNNPFANQIRLDRRNVIDLAELRAALQAEQPAGSGTIGW
jgi:hypothetical protein